jgi:hypothetical protein
MKIHQGLLILSALAVGVFGFLSLCVAAGAQPPLRETWFIVSIPLWIGIILIVLRLLSGKETDVKMQGALPIAALVAAGTVMILTTAYQFANYIMLPVDLLSFAESPFVNDILKLRLGLPIYTIPTDNNSYPYTPGTQILTYSIASVFGKGDSIPFFRAVQFSYVILASIVATGLCDLLARKFLSRSEYRHRLLWIAAWLPLFLLLATEPRFNEYTHSLHNDGLALLVSVCAFWLIVKHSVEPRPWLLACMTVLPAVGFMVKQSQLAWGGIFFLYLLAAPNVSWRQLFYFSIGSASLVGATIGGCYLLWGDPFLFWTFVATGKKTVSILRSFLHLFHAGIYGIMGMFGGWMLALPSRSRTPKVLWLCWLLIFGIEVYTSGLGWHANHIGPGIVIAACWFFVALVKVWPTIDQTQAWWECTTKAAIAVSSVILLFGALGLIRVPQNPVPADFFRYVKDIEKEFVGFAPEKVLMDTGNWIYLREKTLMKDRSETVGIWVGKNQQIDHDFLADTIKRINEKRYDKILARQLDTELSWYDFQDRGSGVKAAILANYRQVRRVQAVQGIETWWPEHLVSDIVVLVPKGSDAVPVLPRSIQHLSHR